MSKHVKPDQRGWSDIQRLFTRQKIGLVDNGSKSAVYLLQGSNPGIGTWGVIDYLCRYQGHVLVDQRGGILAEQREKDKKKESKQPQKRGRRRAT